MDSNTLILIVIAVALFIGLANALRVDGRTAPPPAPAAEPQARAKPAHVHSYALTSSEETGGLRVHVYRCADCGDIERREAPSS